MNRLSLFLSRLPILLLAAHLYVAARLVGWPDNAAQWLGLAGMALCYVAVMAGFGARRAVGRPRGDALAWVGFLALGVFSWLFVFTLARDLLLALWQTLAFAGLWPAAEARWLDASRRAVPLAALLASVWGICNARRVARVKRVEVALPGLPAAYAGYTIVQLSDLHVGPTIKQDYLRRIVERVNALDADLVAVTGDIVDGAVEVLRTHTRPLATLRARDGVYAVTGNHEYYSGAQAWVDELRRLGLTVLMNEHVVLERAGARLVLAGVTDFNAAGFDRRHASDPARALAGAPAGLVRILLAHQPRSAPKAAAAGADLQISGHTHGGQFVPWNFFVPLQQPFVAGLHRVGRLQVYVSRGTGYWGPPMRLGAPSEITLITLKAA